jgi:zinc protease
VSSARALRVRRIEGAPVVSVRVLLPGGARLEPLPGVTLVTGRMLAEGSARRDWRALAELAEAKGMSHVGFGGLEAHGVAVDALADDVLDALELAAELLFEPAFPEERVRWIARQAAAELEEQADHADQLTARAFADLVHSPHPKGRPLQGSAESLALVSEASCRRHHAAAVARGGYVVIAGQIDEEITRRAAARLFEALPPFDPSARGSAEPPAMPERSARRCELETSAADQAHLFVGQLSVARTDPEFEALELAGVILGAGAGLSGRIPSRIRDREGWAYHTTAEAVSAAGTDAGRFVAYAGVAEEQLGAAERAVREELERLVAEGVTDAEVENARSYLLGREPFRRETARQWTDLAAQSLLLSLPIEDARWREARLRAPDRAAIEAALARHLDPGKLAVAVGLPRGKTR